MHEMLDALREYIDALSVSAKSTTRAEDRAKYAQHLASAARLFADLQAGRVTEFRSRLLEEQHTFGWSYLSGGVGARLDIGRELLAGVAHPAQATVDAARGGPLVTGRFELVLARRRGCASRLACGRRRASLPLFGD